MAAGRNFRLVGFGLTERADVRAMEIGAAWPERLYIIDETGHIVYRGGMGPFHYKPAEVREWLAAKYGRVKHEVQTPGAPTSASARTGTTSGASSATTPTLLSAPVESKK